MPTHTLGHLEFSVNEPQTSDVEEKMADTMLRVTAVTLLMTSSVVHSDIVPQGHCLGAILLKYSKLEQFFLSSSIICGMFHVFAEAQTSELSNSAQSCTHHNNYLFHDSGGS